MADGQPNSVIIKNAKTGGLTHVVALGNMQANALRSVATRTPKLGSLDGFEAEKLPGSSTAPVTININPELDVTVFEEGQSTLSAEFLGLIALIEEDKRQYTRALEKFNEEKAAAEAHNFPLKKKYDEAKKSYPANITKWQHANRKKMNKPSFDASDKPKEPVEPIYLPMPVLTVTKPELDSNSVIAAMSKTMQAIGEQDPFDPITAKRYAEAYQLAIFEFVQRSDDAETKKHNADMLSEALNRIEAIRFRMNEMGMPHEAGDMVGRLFDSMINKLSNSDADAYARGFGEEYGTPEYIPDTVAASYMEHFNANTASGPEEILPTIDAARMQLMQNLTLSLSRNDAAVYKDPKLYRAATVSLAKSHPHEYVRLFCQHMLENKNSALLDKYAGTIHDCIIFRSVMSEIDQFYTSSITGMANAQHWQNLGPEEPGSIDVPAGTWATMLRQHNLKLGFSLQESSMVLVIMEKATGLTFAYHADASSHEAMIHSAFISFVHSIYPTGEFPEGIEDSSELFDISIIGGRHPLEKCVELHAAVETMPPEEVAAYDVQAAANSYSVFARVTEVCRINKLVITTTNVFDERMPRSFCIDTSGEGIKPIYGTRASILPKYRTLPPANGTPDADITDAATFMHMFLHPIPEYCLIANLSVDGASAKPPVHSPYIISPHTRMQLASFSANGGAPNLTSALKRAFPGISSFVTANLIHQAYAMKRYTARIQDVVLMNGQAAFVRRHLLLNNPLFMSTLQPAEVVAPKEDTPKITAQAKPNFFGAQTLSISNLLKTVSASGSSFTSGHTRPIENETPVKRVTETPKQAAERQRLNTLIQNQTDSMLDTVWMSLVDRGYFALPIVSEGTTNDKPFTDLMKPLFDAIRRGGISVASIRRNPDGSPEMLYGPLKRVELEPADKARFPELKDGLQPDHAGIASISEAIMNLAAQRWNSLTLHQQILDGQVKG